MKNQIFFYGNCQMIIKDYIYEYIKNFNIHILPCWKTDILEQDFLKILSESDIVITQPIKAGYRDKHYLDTEYILHNAKKDAIIIIFPSVRLDFYYFDFYYYRLKDNTLLKEPSEYHYKQLIKCYLDKKPLSYFIETYIKNINSCSMQDLQNILLNSINQLNDRENKNTEYLNIRDCKIINLSSFIQSNYMKHLLFYTVNHPTAFLMRKLATDILNILGMSNDINPLIDPMYKNERGILYSCIQQMVDFDISDHKPLLSKYNIENTFDILNKYYDTYKNINLV